MRSRQADFLVPDPHIVYFDAVHNSPWTLRGVLPGHNSWSTYRYAVKDIILGIATHRWNPQFQRLEVRAWFAGEHPAFCELEPPRALWVILSSQAWQTGQRLDVWFEHGIPFDLRMLTERRLKEVVPGHARQLPVETARQLYLACSDLPPNLFRDEQKIAPEHICFHTFRGTWTANHVHAMVRRGVPLEWVFGDRLDPIFAGMSNAWLMMSLTNVLIEDYALARLAERKLGVSAGQRICRIEDKSNASAYQCDEPLDIEEGNWIESDSFVHLSAAEQFVIVPVFAWSADGLPATLKQSLLNESVQGVRRLFALPMEFLFLPQARRRECVEWVRKKGESLVVVGATMMQLATEVELKLSITSSREVSDEVESDHVRKFAD